MLPAGAYAEKERKTGRKGEEKMEKEEEVRLVRARRRRWNGVVGGGKARLESRAWLEAHISVNNSGPTACIFLPDSFSLFPGSRKRDKIVTGRFNFSPFPNGAAFTTRCVINYDVYGDVSFTNDVYRGRTRNSIFIVSLHHF